MSQWTLCEIYFSFELSHQLLEEMTGMIQGQCDKAEFKTLMDCVSSNGRTISTAFHNQTVCDPTRITAEICRAYSKIVNCTNSADVSTKTCRPFAMGQITSVIGTPCTVYEFMTTCDTAPLIDIGNKDSGMESIHAVGVVKLCHVIAVFLYLMKKAFEV